MIAFCGLGTVPWAFTQINLASSVPQMDVIIPIWQRRTLLEMVIFSVPTMSETDAKTPDYKSRTLPAIVRFLSHRPWETCEWEAIWADIIPWLRLLDIHCREYNVVTAMQEVTVDDTLDLGT